MQVFRKWLKSFCFSPDEGGSPGGSSTVPPGTAGASGVPDAIDDAAAQSPPDTGTPGAASGIPGADGGGGGGLPAPGASPPATPQPSWLAALKEQGLGEFQDEKAALAAISQFVQQARQQAQQYSQVQPWVQSYQQNAAAFAQWMKDQHSRTAQGQPAHQHQPQQPQAWWSDLWQPPEYNPAWEGMLQLDEHGNIQPKPGTPPEVAAKYMAHRQFQQEQIRNLTQNPYQFFEKAIDRRAQEIAQRVVQQHLTQHVDTQRSQQFVQENNYWLWNRDPQTGQVQQQTVYDPMTNSMVYRPVLSQWGNLFGQVVQREHQRQSQRGYCDYEEQKRVAQTEVYLQYLLSTQQAPQQGQQPQQPVQPQAPMTPRQQANQKFMDQNNPAAQLPGIKGNARGAKQPITRKNYAEMLKRAFAENGVTNETLLNELLNQGR